MRYAIRVDRGWRTESAHLWAQSAGGLYERRLEADGRGRWRIDGAPAPALDGLLDVDLEASAMTNAFPVRRMRLLNGWDDIALTGSYRDRIASFKAADQGRRPWAVPAVGGSAGQICGDCRES